MALRREIVDFLGLSFSEQSRERAAIGQVAVVKEEAIAALVRVGVNGFEPARVERARAADDPMHFVALAQQQFREIRPVLSSDSSDQCLLCHKSKTRF